MVNILHMTGIRLLQYNTNNINLALLHLHLKGIGCTRFIFGKN